MLVKELKQILDNADDNQEVFVRFTLADSFDDTIDLDVETTGADDLDYCCIITTRPLWLVKR